jgi:hypothetical protein
MYVMSSAIDVPQSTRISHKPYVTTRDTSSKSSKALSYLISKFAVTQVRKYTYKFLAKLIDSQLVKKPLKFYEILKLLTPKSNCTYPDLVQTTLQFYTRLFKIH